MRQAIIDLVAVTEGLKAEVTALKQQSGKTHRSRWSIVLQVGAILTVGFFTVYSSIDSLPYNLMRLMTTDTPFRTALCR